jgi:hypothetical protein
MAQGINEETAVIVHPDDMFPNWFNIDDAKERFVEVSKALDYRLHQPSIIFFLFDHLKKFKLKRKGIHKDMAMVS